ncbi:MAG TPA: hypothetical protein VEW46_10675 [Pyrinomonadaceae bacterium]|nr:hypothetical protein [Pyrinomonadaceae bacterium]
MQPFAELGAVVESRWRDKNYHEDLFPDIAAQALSEMKLPERLTAWDIIRWLYSTPALPEQMDVEAKFGNPPITLFSGPRFYIDTYFWLDGTTSIHQHAFSGAFQVLLGSSVHARYEFEKQTEINPHLLTGKISLREVALLRKGDICEIVAGPTFIHSLFHLERPSATITIRSYKTPNAPVQYSYHKPFLARNPFFTDPLLKRRVQTVELLLRMKHPEADTFIGELIDSSDFQTAYLVLSGAFEFLCHRELEEMLDVSRSRDRFQALLDRALAKHGELAGMLLPSFEEEWRKNEIVRRRAEVKGEDHRFFLALLLNVPDLPNTLRLVQERFPEKDPVELIVEWVKRLAATKSFGSREANVLGIGEFDDNHLFVFKGLLQCLTIEEIEAQATASGISGNIPELADHIKGISLFKSLFASDGV